MILLKAENKRIRGRAYTASRKLVRGAARATLQNVDVIL